MSAREKEKRRELAYMETHRWSALWNPKYLTSVCTCALFKVWFLSPLVCFRTLVWGSRNKQVKHREEFQHAALFFKQLSSHSRPVNWAHHITSIAANRSLQSFLQFSSRNWDSLEYTAGLCDIAVHTKECTFHSPFISGLDKHASVSGPCWQGQ